MTTIPRTDTLKPKRILIFSFVYYPRFIGGAEIAIKEITDRVSSQDIEFDLVALRIDKKLPRFERIGNVNVYRIGFAGINALLQILCRGTCISTSISIHFCLPTLLMV